MNKDQILRDVLGSGKGTAPEEEVQAFSDAIIADRVRAMQKRRNVESVLAPERDEIAIPDPEIDESAPLTSETNDVATDEPEIIAQPIAREPLVTGGRSLRQMRQEAAMKSLPVAPKLELLKDDELPSKESLPVEQPKDAPAALEAIHKAADKGIEAALPPLNKEAEELAPLVAMERFDESGTLMPKSDTLVMKDKFQEGGIVVPSREGNEEIIADALKSNNELAAADSTPAEANDLRAARLLGKVNTAVAPEMPIADIVPEAPKDVVEGPFLSDSVKQTNTNESGGANIIFGRNESKPVGAIEDKALEHDGNGSADLKRPDRMEPVLPEGLASPKAPVIPKKEMINLEPKKLAENADQLVSEAGGLAEAAPTEVIVDNSKANITEPHPFVAAGAPVQEQIIPLATGEKTDEQKLVDMIANGESLDGTVPVAETPVEVKTAPEVAIATPEVVPAQSGFKPELLRGNEQPSDALKAVPPVVQPEAPAAANADPSGIWQPKAKKGIFSKWFGDKHAAHELAYVKNPNITAEQVLGHVGTEDGADTPQVAEKAA